MEGRMDTGKRRMDVEEPWGEKRGDEVSIKESVGKAKEGKRKGGEREEENGGGMREKEGKKRIERKAKE